MFSLGNLHLLPVLVHLDLVGAPTAEFLRSFAATSEVWVSEIDPTLSDTAAFCEFYKVPLEITGNCVVLEAKRADRTWYAACVIPGSTRADVNGLARRTLDARKVSFAPMEKAVELTHMEYGAITPIGLPNVWPILVDKTIAEAEYVLIGSGIRKSKIALPGNVLASLPNVQVLGGLGQVKTG